MCMSLAAQTAEQERVVPTTQQVDTCWTRTTGKRHNEVVDLRARVTRQVDAGRRRRDGAGFSLITLSDVLLMDKVRD